MECSHGQKISFKIGQEPIQGLFFSVTLRDFNFILEAPENLKKIKQGGGMFRI